MSAVRYVKTSRGRRRIVDTRCIVRTVQCEYEYSYHAIYYVPGMIFGYFDGKYLLPYVEEQVHHATNASQKS